MRVLAGFGGSLRVPAERCARERIGRGFPAATLSRDSPYPFPTLGREA